MTPEELATASQAELVQAVLELRITASEAIQVMAKRWLKISDAAGGMPTGFEWNPTKDAHDWMKRELEARGELRLLDTAWMGGNEEQITESIKEQIAEEKRQTLQENIWDFESSAGGLNIGADADALADAAAKAAADAAGDEGGDEGGGYPRGLGSREQALFEQEAAPWNVFQQYLLGMPGYGQMSPGGKSALQRLSGPMQSAWLTGLSRERPKEYDDPGAAATSFRNFLARGGADVGLPAAFQRFGDISSAFQIDPEMRTEEQKFMGGFWKNPDVRDQFLGAVEPSVNPFLRNAFRNYLSNEFLKFQAKTPEKSFAHEIPRFKGILGVQ